MNRQDLVSTLVNRNVSASGDEFLIAQQNGSRGRDDMFLLIGCRKCSIYTTL